MSWLASHRARISCRSVAISLAISLALSFTLVSSWASNASRAHAQSSAFADPINGFGPDMQVTGGVGAALDGSIDNPFLARLRLGALYALEPLSVHFGVTGELGVLAELGVGGELELSHFDGYFVQLGAARTKHADLLVRASAGYAIAGVEWQHRFADARDGGDSDALLFVVRFPIGLWWLLRERDEAPPPSAARLPRPAPVEPPVVAVEEERSAPEPALEARERARAHAERGATASAAGDHALAALSYAQAYADTSDATFLLPLADAEAARSQLRAAEQTLERYLASEGRQTDAPARAKLEEVRGRMPKVRLVMRDAQADVTVTIDDVATPEVLLGYDVAVDPGAHTLVLSRPGKEPLTRNFEAKERELVRVEIDLDAPSSPSP